jgi:hypothetical protein
MFVIQIVYICFIINPFNQRHMTALLIAIYVAGMVPAYLLYKRITILDGDKWTIGYRKRAFTTSLLSWITVLSALIAIGAVALINLKKDDRPAKW